MAGRAALEAQAELANRLSGLACTQVSLGVAETLIVDFGELEPNDQDDLAGLLVLAVDCPWRIDGPDLPAVGWEDEEEDIAHFATVLIGATVEDIEVRRPGFDLILTFSHNHRLRVFPDCRAYYSDELSGGALPWQLAGRGLPASTPLGPEAAF